MLLAQTAVVEEEAYVQPDVLHTISSILCDHSWQMMYVVVPQSELSQVSVSITDRHSVQTDASEAQPGCFTRAITTKIDCRISHGRPNQVPPICMVLNRRPGVEDGG